MLMGDPADAPVGTVPIAKFEKLPGVLVAANETFTAGTIVPSTRAVICRVPMPLPSAIFVCASPELLVVVLDALGVADPASIFHSTVTLGAGLFSESFTSTIRGDESAADGSPL